LTTIADDYTGEAIWYNTDHDEPVTVTGFAGVRGGIRFFNVEGSAAAIPEDELRVDHLNPLLTAALEYAERGWPVFPCEGKKPLTTHGFKQASANPLRIRYWWRRWPQANIGIPTGPETFTVLDVDPRNGGDDTLHELITAHSELPTTPAVITGSGGTHYWFRHPPQALVSRAGALGPGLDLKASGGYVVVPPSVHPDTGTEYEWEVSAHIEDTVLAEMPAWLLALATTEHSSNGHGEERPAEFGLSEDVAPAARALEQLADWRCDDYHAWVEVGMALSELGPIGLALWDQWSKKSAKYQPGACQEKWESFRAGHGRTLASLLHWAQQDQAAFLSTADHTADPELETPTVPAHSLPSIDASCQDLRVVTTQAWDALLQANTANAFVFRYGGIPVRIERTDKDAPVVRELTPDRTRHELARVALWHTYKEDRKGRTVRKPAKPPMDVVRDVLATPDPPLPVLTRVVEAPVFAADGSLQTEPGYHSRSQTYYAPPGGLQVPPVSASPTDMEVEIARKLILDDLLSDFPFVHDSDRAQAVGLLLLPFVRDLIDGATPNHLIEAPVPGSGKGLCADCLLLPAVGTNVSLIAEARDDEEWRKRITAALRDGRAAILIDNVARVLNSGPLAAAITAPTWTDRVLGQTELVSIPVRCVWVTTANNPTMSTEIARRSIRIRLDPKQDRPWLREGFRHDNLRDWASENRGRLIWAALTLAQSWLSAGRPPAPDTKLLGSFESWSRVIGGILAHADIPGFLGNLDEFYEAADLEGAVWREFVDVWWATHQTNEVGVAELFPLAEAMDGFDLGKGSERSRKITFGKQLMKQRDRVVGEYRITKTREVKRIAQWRLLPTRGGAQLF